MSLDNEGERISRRQFLKAIAPLAWTTRLAIEGNQEPAIFWHGDRARPLTAITFDDCYSIAYMQELERWLDENQEIKITFFPVGVALLKHAQRDPGLWRRLISRGHEIGYHGYQHIAGSQLTTQQMMADFERFHEALAQILGRSAEIHLARPPYGDLSISFLNLCAQRDLSITMWSAAFSHDQELLQREMDRLQAGDILLFHLGYWDLRNFEACIPVLSERSLASVTLSRLLFPESNPAHRIGGLPHRPPGHWRFP